MLFQLCKNGEIFKRSSVTLDFAVCSEFTQEAAHDFAAAGFGQGVGEADVVWLGEGADFLLVLLKEQGSAEALLTAIKSLTGS